MVLQQEMSSAGELGFGGFKAHYLYTGPCILHNLLDIAGVQCSALHLNQPCLAGEVVNPLFISLA